jgi:putative membrane protein
MKSFSQAVALLVALATGSSAFVSPANHARVTTAISVTTKQPPAYPASLDISYGEESRKYRRTVYSHEDWVKHRSPDRFVRNLLATPNSGVYKNLAKEVLATTSIATLLVLWNGAVGGYSDLEGVHHAALINNIFFPLLALPLAPFTISSPSLGLLLGKFAKALF